MLKQYKLGFGHMGNGITVWNSEETVSGDFKTIAHIGEDRAVKFYDELPTTIQFKIIEFAANSNPMVSATQNNPVFCEAVQPC